MPMITIILDGDGAAPELATSKVHHVTDDFKVMALSGGMESGRPSVGIVARLEDGSHVFLKTSMRCFLAAAKAFEARFGVETYVEEGDGNGGNRN